MNRILMLVGGLFLMAFVATAQPATTVYTEAWRSYKRGMDFYEKDLVDMARREFKNVLTMQLPQNEPDFRLLRNQSGLYYAKCAVRLDLPDGEKLILDFIRETSPDPVAGQALVEMGNYYYNSGEYDKANEFFELMDIGGLSNEQRADMKFKQAYGMFVKKEFTKAKPLFKFVTERGKGDNVDGANYYLGMISFFENKFNDAISYFQKSATNKRYKDQIPYYLCQIYFGQKQYDRVIDEGKKVLGTGSKNERELNQLVGQSYFEKADFPNAVRHLEMAAGGGATMRAEDFYQLGYAQYQTGGYKKAIPNFEQLNKTESLLGQSAMYSLGDCHLKAGNKTSARNAFATASKMTFDKGIQEDAAFNYAKLSYELKYDREAINTLQTFRPTSKYYAQSQEMLSDLLLSSRDYAGALTVIDAMPEKTTKIRETYQKVCLYRGIQLYKEGRANEAETLFQKAIDGIDTETKALGYYWLGESQHYRKDYDASNVNMGKFVSLAKSLRGLSDETNIYSANYIMGYNYLKKQDYTTAQKYFVDCVASIKKDASSISSDYIEKKVMPDAVMRAGDCSFKKNKYDDALKYYNEAYDKRYTGFVYALYQKGIIEGLRGKTVEKLLLLERVPKEFPESEYADDALFQIGATYQQINKLDQALPPFKKLVADYKGKTDLFNAALLRLGLISYNQGNTEQAINYYKQVFSYNPNADDAKEALAALEEIYVKDLAKPDEYFAFLETIPGYKVGNVEKDNINFKSAEAQFENGNYEKAIEAYTTYLAKYPNGPNSLQARYNRGESYAVLKKYSEAFKDYDAVVQKGNSKSYVKAIGKAAAIAYNHDKNFNRAFELYVLLEKESTEDEQRFEAQLGAMRAAYRTNNATQVDAYARKVATNTKATKEQQGVANFYIGKSAFDKKNYTEAVAAFNKVLTLSTSSEQQAEARYHIALVNYQTRKLDEAIAMCEQLAEKNGDQETWVAKSIILQSDIYAEKGDLFNARAALEAVIENFTADATIVAEAKEKLRQLEAKEKASTRLRSSTDDGKLQMDNGN